jgi:hypothetical protein
MAWVGLMQYAISRLPHGQELPQMHGQDTARFVRAISARHHVSSKPLKLRGMENSGNADGVVDMDTDVSSISPEIDTVTDTLSFNLVSPYSTESTTDATIDSNLYVSTMAITSDTEVSSTTTVILGAATADMSAYVLETDVPIDVQTVQPSSFRSGIDSSASEVRLSLQSELGFATQSPTVASELSAHTTVQPESKTFTLASTAYVPETPTPTATADGYVSVAKPTAKSTTTGAPPSPDNALVGHNTLYKWTAVQVFESAYLPVLIAVSYRTLWAVVYSNANLIEPFQQLAKPEGAPAERIFFRFYQAQTNFLGPLMALVNHSWNLALVGGAYILASVLPALVSEAFVVNTNWDCAASVRTQSDVNPCPPYLEVNLPILRAVQGVLALEAIALIFIIGHGLSRKTGLPSNPSSMATISCMIQSPALDHVMNAVSAESSIQTMRERLQGKRFRLAYYQADNGRTDYGVVPMTSSMRPSLIHYDDSSQDNLLEENSFLSGQRRSFISHLRVVDIILLVIVSGTFGVILSYYLVGGDNAYNRFFSSDTFGPRFVLTGAATIMASIWRSVEQGKHASPQQSLVRAILTTPGSLVSAAYHRMAKKPSGPASTILFKPSTTPLFSTVNTATHGYYFVATLTLMTFLAEGMSVVVSGVPFAAGQTWMELLVSTYMALAILGLMMVVSALVIFRRFSEPELPLKPESLIAVMSYLYSSSMISDFRGMVNVDERSRNRKIKDLSKRYVFRRAISRDSRYVWKVDEWIPGTSNED